MQPQLDKYHASTVSSRLNGEPPVEFTVTSGFVYWAPPVIGWIQGLHLGPALVRLRRMGWKVEKVADTNRVQDSGGQTP